MSVDELYRRMVEPLLGPLNAKTIDWTALRAMLPSGTSAGSRVDEGLRVVGAMMFDGALEVRGGVELCRGGLLVVLGDLSIEGALYSPPLQYSAVVVGGTLRVGRAHTSGDVIALGGISAEVWWGSYNDHSTYAPSLHTRHYVAVDRHDVIEEIVAEVRHVAPPDHLDLDDESAVRRYLGATPIARKTRPATPEERAELSSAVTTALAHAERSEVARALGIVYAVIETRGLADLGELVVRALEHKLARGPGWSIQDELDLLVELRRADLLESLDPTRLGGFAGWLPSLIARARG